MTTDDPVLAEFLAKIGPDAAERLLALSEAAQTKMTAEPEALRVAADARQQSATARTKEARLCARLAADTIAAEFDTTVRQLLADAQPPACLRGRRETEDRRVAAVTILRKILRAQVLAFEHAEEDEIERYSAAAKVAPKGGPILSALAEITRADFVNPEIDLFFARAANAIWSAPDPVAALADFLGERGRRGRPPKKEVKDDLALVLFVREKRAGGMTLEAALQSAVDAGMANARGGPADPKNLQRRYERAIQNRAVRAALAERAFEAEADEIAATRDRQKIVT